MPDDPPAPPKPGLLKRTLSRWRDLQPITRTRTRFGLSGFLLGFLLATALFTKSCRISAPDVHVVKSSSGSVHPAIAGRPVLAKAVLEPRPGRLLKYSWDFGDDSDPVTGMVSDPYAVSASHLYMDTEIGQKFTATLTVTDVESEDQTKGEYKIRFVKPTTENKATIALDDGLWNLHATLDRTNDPVRGETGLWNRSNFPIGTTAMAALAFEVNGFDGRSERRKTPYAETVDRALNTIIGALQVHKLEESDAMYDLNGNGFGLTVGGDKVLYEQPLITMALLASQSPDRVARTGPEGVIGRSYQDLVADLLEFLAYAQIDKGQSGRGGWRYDANSSSGGDMSVTQWPVLAFMSAEEVWNLESPDYVRDELKYFLRTVQANDGSFGYTSAATGQNNGLTGAGIIAHAFAGTKFDDPAINKARAAIGKNWDSNNIGDYYAMYAIMKAAKLTKPNIRKFGDHEWHPEYVDALFASQTDTGAWPTDANYATGTLATAWPALVLSRDIFAKGKPLSLLWKVGITLGLLLIIVILVIALSTLKKRRSSQPSSNAPPPDAEEPHPDPTPDDDEPTTTEGC